ncbi:MAG: glycosyltransferase, partial [Dictyoglomaceae bacterium]|nr:glycosyltransferase [Dictyoglomaceae bacterium]
DNSQDRTEEIAKSYNIKVISLLKEPPPGWIGKNWALWNGVINSSGDLLLFLDSDVEPDREFLEVMIINYEKYGGFISCWPYQRFERIYEHLNLIFNLVSIFSMFFLGRKDGAFGPAILISREDYNRIGGHKEVKGRIVEDMFLAKKCVEKGISIHNFLGEKYIKFRMYPEGIGDLFRGFTKNMAKGAFSINLINFIFIFLFVYGLYGSVFQLLNNKFILYPLYGIQIYIISKRLGDYKWYDSLFYPLHLMFFLIVFIYSIFRSFFIKTVFWKGREIHVD